MRPMDPRARSVDSPSTLWRRCVALSVRAALALIVAALALGSAHPASAAQASARVSSQPAAQVAHRLASNSGDVKIQDGNGNEFTVDKNNEPHVLCSFYVHGFNMAATGGSIVITQHPPTGWTKMTINPSSWKANDGINPPLSPSSQSNEFIEGPYTLPVGHYHLNVTDNKGNNISKQKTFWVDDCPSPKVVCPTGAAAVVQSSVHYIVNKKSPPIPISINGHVSQGDTVTVSFTVAAGCSNITVSFVGYKAPGPTWNANTADQQTVTNYQSGTFSAGGPYQLTVVVPSCFYQLDFVTGMPITTLGPVDTNPNNFYHNQGNFIDGANGGTTACPVTPPPPCDAIHGPAYYLPGGGYFTGGVTSLSSLLLKTIDFKTMTPVSATSILTDTSTDDHARYFRYLLTAQLNAAASPLLAAGIPTSDSGVPIQYGQYSQVTVGQFIHEAYEQRDTTSVWTGYTYPSTNSPLAYAVYYLGGAGTAADYATCKVFIPSTPGGYKTPELGSGELLATGLLPLAGVMLYRRRRRVNQS